MFLGLDSAVHPDRLIGLWDSASLDFGAMEATKLALLPDGRGWTELANAAGALDVRRLTWDVPRPDVIELRYALAIDGNTGQQERDYEFVRTQYSAGENALRLSEPIDFARQFALTKRSVDVTDDPSHELVPYEESGT
jgi:hypothetical protein